MQHEATPTVHYQKPNPQIDLGRAKLEVVDRLRTWEAPRHAGVSSFGLGGTNVHVILEDGALHRDFAEVPSSRPTYLFPLSARSEASLRTMMCQLADTVETQPHLQPRDVAYTLQMGRREFAYRHLVQADDLVSLGASLRDLADFTTHAPHVCNRTKRIALAFPAVTRLSAELVQRAVDVPLFQAAIRQAQELAKRTMGASYRTSEFWQLYIEGESFSVQRRLLELLLSIGSAEYLLGAGLDPTVLLATRLGILPASVVAGVVSLSEAVAILSEDIAEDGDGLERIRTQLASRFDRNPAILLTDAKGHRLTRESLLHRFGEERTELPPLELKIDSVVEISAGGHRSDSYAGIGTTNIVSSWCCDQQAVLPLLPAIGHSWLAGHKIRWDALYPDEKPRRVSLPGYPFERRRLWLDRMKTSATENCQPAVAPARIERGQRDVRIQGWTDTVSNVELAERIANYMAGVAAELLRVSVESIALDAGLFDLGLTSVQFLDWAKRIEAAIGYPLNPILVMEYPTIRMLAGKLSLDLLQTARNSDGYSSPRG